MSHLRFIWSPFLLCASLWLLWLSLPPTQRAAANQAGALALVSAASYEGAALAPESIVAAFGVRLATAAVAATDDDLETPGFQLPTELDGTTVEVNGRLAGLFFVSPGQINFVVPAATESGAATVLVRALDGTTSRGVLTINAVAPALFVANGDGRGVAAANVVRVRANGTQVFETLSQFDAPTRRHLPRPLDLGPEGETLVLVLYGSGLRRAPDLNGDGNLNDQVRLLLGGVELRPSFVGRQPGFVGLDQVNTTIPRSLAGRGIVSLAVSVTGVASSNVAEIEIGSLAGAAPPRINSFAPFAAQVGQTILLKGNGFAPNPAENPARLRGAGQQAEAQTLAATPNDLTLLLPFGAASGPVGVRTAQGEAVSPDALTIRTSLSGSLLAADGAALAGATVRVRDERGQTSTAVTDAHGVFLVLDPGVGAATVEFDAGPVYPRLSLPVRIAAGRDNQFATPIALQAANGARINVGAAATAGEINLAVPAPATREEAAGPTQSGALTLELPAGTVVRFPDGGTTGVLTLTLVEQSRTPTPLPPGRFSSAIAQLTPFGAAITPGARLIFPNADGFPAGAAVRLFRFDQRSGGFLDAGAATVTSNGQRLETAAGAITETGLYFAALAQPTATLYGRAVESDGKPLRGVVVQARGQSVVTDGNGGYVLRHAPLRSGSFVVEASLLRPTHRIDRTRRELAAPALVGTILVPDLVFAAPGGNAPPVIQELTLPPLNTGETRSFAFTVSDPDPGQTVETLLSGSDFATLAQGGGGAYTLTLAPGANDGGNYTLLVTALDNLGAVATRRLALEVRGVGVRASDQTAATDEDTPLSLTLRGSDPAGRPVRFVLASLPEHGRLSGAAPDLIYTPEANYNGADQFFFTVTNGQAESSRVQFFLVIRPLNDAPVLTVPGPQTVNAGQTLSFVVSAQDVDAEQTLNFTATGLPSGAQLENLSPTSRRFTWTPTFTQPGNYTVSFRVADSGTPPLSASRNVTIMATAKWAQTSGPGGGAIRALYVNGATLYAGSRVVLDSFTGLSGGRAFVSTDTGRSWLEAGDSLPDQGVLTFGGTSNEVYAITGLTEPLSATDTVRGSGVYRTADGGRTWNRIPIPTQTSSGFFTGSFTAVAASGPLVFVGTSSGYVYRATNTGLSVISVSTGLPSSSIRALAVLGTTLIAGTGAGIYQTSNNGQSWLETSAGLTNGDVRALAVAGTTLYAGCGYSGFVGARPAAVFRSADQGRTWTRVNTDLPIGDRAQVFAVAAVGETVFVGTTEGVFRAGDGVWTPVNTGLPVRRINALAVLGGTLFAGLEGSGIFTSTDLGQTWTESNSGIRASEVGALTANGTTLLASVTGSGVSRSTNQGQSWTRTLAHPAVSGVVAGGANVFAATNGEGVFRSTDDGQNWQATNSGLSTRNVTALGAAGPNLFAQTDRGVFISSNQGAQWTATDEGLTRAELSAFAVLGDALFVGTAAIFDSANPRSGVFRSRDGGQTWTPARRGLERPDGSFQPIFHLLAVGATLYAGTPAGVFRSADQGENWASVSAGLPITNSFTGERSVVALTASATTLYAGTSSRGVYKSTNQGQSWVAANRNIDGASIGTMAVKGNTVFFAADGPRVDAGVYLSNDEGETWERASTGIDISSASRFETMTVLGDEVFVYSITTASIIYRTSDNGRTWVRANQGLTGGGGPLFLVGTTLYCASSNGLFTSTDRGATWRGAANRGFPAASALALGVVGGNVVAGTLRGNFRSSNNGDDWTPLTGGLSEFDFFATGEAAVFAGSRRSGVYRSTDQGRSWQRVNTARVTALTTSGGALFVGDGSGLQRSTDNGQTFRALANSSSLTALGAGGGLLFTYFELNQGVGRTFVSTDQGDSFREISSGLTRNASQFLVSGQNVFAATRGGGVFLLSNNAQSWTEISNGLGAKHVNTVALAGAGLIAGTQGGGVFRLPDQSGNWAEANTGLPPGVSALALAFGGAQLFVGSFGQGVYRSLNQGATWTAVNTGLTNRFVQTLAASGNTLFAGTLSKDGIRGGVFRSTDGGQNWARVGQEIEPSEILTLVSDGDRLLAGTDGGGVFVSTDQGTTWRASNQGLTALDVRTIVRHGASLFLGTLRSGVFRSTDQGASWAPVNTNMPTQLAVFTLQSDGATLYAGTVFGVFRSSDEGRSWLQINAGLGSQYVFTLALSRDNIFAGTLNGVFVSPQTTAGR